MICIASTGERFRDFGPYVASIDNQGLVAFQATLQGGASGVFCGEGGPVTTLAEGAEFYSHPDIEGPQACVYARHPERVLILGEGITAIPGPFHSVGPLGPTLRNGKVAFRADGAIFVGTGEGCVSIADTSGPFRGFQGLPVINRQGTVVFRADLKDGRQGIYKSDGTVVAHTGDVFESLGYFPDLNDDGTVVFQATLREGGQAIFTSHHGRLTLIADTSGPLESLRGAFLNNAGQIVLCATPHGETLGIYAGPRILGLGDPLYGSTVTDFALNPVSLNDAGQLAIRLALADGSQRILRV